MKTDLEATEFFAANVPEKLSPQVVQFISNDDSIKRKEYFAIDNLAPICVDFGAFVDSCERT